MSANKRLTVRLEIWGTIVRFPCIGNFLRTPMANGPSTGFGVLAGYGNDLGELFTG